MRKSNIITGIDTEIKNWRKKNLKFDISIINN